MAITAIDSNEVISEPRPKVVPGPTPLSLTVTDRKLIVPALIVWVKPVIDAANPVFEPFICNAIKLAIG